MALSTLIVPFKYAQLTSSFVRQIAAPILPALAASLSSFPSISQSIWESILRAVPKKKTSHMKKRHRQMAGKALKDVTSLCKCPACGRTKRLHYLCPYCMQTIREMLRRNNE